MKVNPKPSISNINTTYCSNDNIVINPTNGTNGIVPTDTRYTWVVANYNNLTGQSNQSVPQNNISQKLSNPTNSTQVINYTVTPSTLAGCVGAPFTLSVDVKATPIIANYTSATLSPICSGNSFLVNPAITPGNVLPAGTTYTWNVVNNIDINGYSDQITGLPSIGQTLGNLKNTNQSLIYNVTATTLESCSSTFSITVTVKPTSVIANKAEAICTGKSFDVTPVNGTDIVPSGTTYTWTVLPNANIGGESNQLTPLAKVSQNLTNTTNTAQTATYSVSSILNNGCTGGNFMAVITVNPLPVVTVNASKTAVCDGESLNLAGVGAQTYTWDNGVSNGVDFVPPNSKIYTVTGTDLNGCINTASQSIVVNPHPVVTLASSTVDRCGTGSMVLTASADFGTVKWYDLNSGGIVLGSGNSLNIPSISESTSYYADALSLAGCYAITRKQVNAVVKVIPTISKVEDNFNCGPGSVTLKAFPTAGVVNWYANNSAGASLKTGTTYATASIDKTTTYYVDATFDNCTTLSRVAVKATVDTIPIITTTDPLPVCYPLTQDITNSASIVLANSAITYSYWKDINAIQSIANPSAIPVSGTYYIKASDTYNCFDIKPVDIVVNPLPASPVANNVSYCQYDVAINLTANVLQNHKLNWYDQNANGGIARSIGAIPVTTFPGVQNFYVSQVSDITSCESPRSMIEVTINALPVIVINSSANPICYADNLTLTASGGVSYLWDKGVVDSQPFKITESTRYTVIGTDINGCKNTNYIDEVVKPLPIVKPLEGNLTICSGASLNLLNSVSVGTPPYTYLINSDSASVTSSPSGILFGKKAGIAKIYYKAIDSYGCTSENSQPFQVAVYEPVKSQIFYREAFYDMDTKIKTKIDSGYSIYDWSPRVNLNNYGIKDPIFKGIDPITYTLYRLDPTSNCLVTDTYNITINNNVGKH